MKPPPISVTCECGTERDLLYGESWQCEECGRRWNTAQIPAEEYRSLERAVRRYELGSLAFAALLVAVFAPLMVLVDVRLGITGLIVFFAWSFFVRPRRRRRLLETVRRSAHWQLRPE